MDKIWDRNPSKSEVIGRCGGDKKAEWPRGTDNSRTLKKHLKQQTTTYVTIRMFKYMVIPRVYCNTLVKSLYNTRIRDKGQNTVS